MADMLSAALPEKEHVFQNTQSYMYFRATFIFIVTMRILAALTEWRPADTLLVMLVVASVVWWYLCMPVLQCLLIAPYDKRSPWDKAVTEAASIVQYGLVLMAVQLFSQQLFSTWTIQSLSLNDTLIRLFVFAEAVAITCWLWF